MRRGHSVIIVAEGAGEHLMTGPGGADASGNKKLGDIGVFLKGKIEEYFRSRETELTLKYIDPSYMIRSVPASPQDRIYCMRLGQAAVHAAMAGKTGIVVGRWHSTYVHLPISLVTSARKQVDPKATSGFPCWSRPDNPPVLLSRSRPTSIPNAPLAAWLAERLSLGTLRFSATTRWRFLPPIPSTAEDIRKPAMRGFAPISGLWYPETSCKTMAALDRTSSLGSSAASLINSGAKNFTRFLSAGTSRRKELTGKDRVSAAGDGTMPLEATLPSCLCAETHLPRVLFAPPPSRLGAGRSG